MPKSPEEEFSPTLKINVPAPSDPKLRIHSGTKEEKSDEIKAALKAENEKKEKENQDMFAALSAKNAQQKPLEVHKDPTNKSRKGGSIENEGADPKQPNKYNPANISSELWIFNFGVAFVAWAHMRHVRAIKHEGKVDKGAKYMLTKAWDAGAVWFAIGAGVAAVRSAFTGKMTDPLTESMLAEFGSEHQVNSAKKELDLATRKKNSDPQEIKEKEEAYKDALENHVGLLKKQLESAKQEDPTGKTEKKINTLEAALSETEKKLEKLQQPSATNTTTKDPKTNSVLGKKFKEAGDKLKALFQTSQDATGKPSAESTPSSPMIFRRNPLTVYQVATPEPTADLDAKSEHSQGVSASNSPRRSPSR